MQPRYDSLCPTPNDTPSASRQHRRDVDVDPPTDSSTTSAVPPAKMATTPTTVSAPPPDDDEGDDLEHQSRDFLLQRARALERQLKIRNGDCARLLTERQQLLPLREKCESQKEMILALRGQLDLAQAQRESAVDAMETMKRRQRDQEHRDRVTHAEHAMYGVPQQASSPASASQRPYTAAPGPTTGSSSAPQPAASMPNIGRRNPGGTVVSTAAGPQLLYDSSDISSVGFTSNAKLPFDFLGGPGAQQQYLARHSGRGADRGAVPDGGNDASEDGQVRRLVDAAKDQAEMEAKYSAMEDKEEEALMARIKALREGRK